MFSRKDSIRVIIQKSIFFTLIFLLIMNIFEFGLNFTQYTYEVVPIIQLILTLIFMYIFSLILEPKKRKKLE